MKPESQAQLSQYFKQLSNKQNLIHGQDTIIWKFSAQNFRKYFNTPCENKYVT